MKENVAELLFKEIVTKTSLKLTNNIEYQTEAALQILG